jgi:hypothetical protein
VVNGKKITHSLRNALVICASRLASLLEKIGLDLHIRIGGSDANGMDIGENALGKAHVLRHILIAHCGGNSTRAFDKSLAGDIGGRAVNGSCAKEGTDAHTGNGPIAYRVYLTVKQADASVTCKLAVYLGKIRTRRYSYTEYFFKKSFFKHLVLSFLKFLSHNYIIADKK